MDTTAKPSPDLSQLLLMIGICQSQLPDTLAEKLAVFDKHVARIHARRFNDVKLRLICPDPVHYQAVMAIRRQQDLVIDQARKLLGGK